MPDTVFRNEIIKSLRFLYRTYNLTKTRIAPIRQKDGSRLSVQNIHMTDSVLLFVFLGILMPPDRAAQIIIDRSTTYDSGLGMSLIS